MEISRHKVNPGLLVTPKHAGGIGLAAFSVATKTTYKACGCSTYSETRQILRCMAGMGFSGRFGARCNSSYSTSGSISGVASPHTLIRTEAQARACERLTSTTDQQSQLTAWSSVHSTALHERVTNWWEGDEVVLSFIDCNDVLS